MSDPHVDRHVAVIDPGTRVAERESFERMVGVASIPLSYHLPAMEGMDSLFEVQATVAGVVIFGSGASVHDDLPWQDALAAWLGPLARAGLPVLGLCYGHQLVAHLFGGGVGFLFDDRRKLRGTRVVSLDSNRLWGAGKAGPLVVSHREAVVTCPTDFEIVGRSDSVAIEAIAHRSLPIWGLQAHPEATAAFVENNALPVVSDAATFPFGHAIVDAFTRFVGDYSRPSD